MTLAHSPAQARDRLVVQPSDWQSRSEIDLAAQQLQAVDRFNSARRTREQAAAAAARSRELRMDASRSLEVLRRQHDAVVSRADAHLRASGQLLRRTAQRRAVLAHRNEWLTRKLSQTLEDGDVHVVACTENGADAVGLVIAEQPDVVLVEDTLAMLAGIEVIREIRRFCPWTVVVAHAAHGDRVSSLLDAGATTVVTRSVPPHDVARSLLELVGAA